jgi:NTE family protein
VERARTGFVKHPPNKDYTLPMIAMVHGGRSNLLMKSMYGETLIENLWTPFFCVSTNLTRAESRVTREGSLWRWVRASCSPPGLAPPIFAEGQMFADGGILDNLPVGVMRSSPGVGVTIASDTGAAANDASRNLPSFDSVSGWTAFLNRKSTTGRHAALPTLAEILMLTSTINSVPAGHEAKRLADLYLHPPAAGVKAVDWKAIDRLVDAGYHYGIEHVQAWQAAQ